MKILLCFIALPCLIAADVKCPDGKISCPSGKVCCPVDEQYKCCDPESEPQGKRNVFAGVETVPGYGDLNTTNANSQNAYCLATYCPASQPCCYYSFCCPFSSGYCCSATQCCQYGYRCCAYSKSCCPTGTKCCNNGYSEWCCKNKTTCGFNANTCIEPDHCCANRQCCQSGYFCCPYSTSCCPTGTKCCNDGISKWCCKNKTTCGYRANVCIGAGVTFKPAITGLAVLFFAALLSKKYF